MFALGNVLHLAGLGAVPDDEDISGFADFEDYVSEATLADRMVAARFVVSAAAAVLGAVMVRTLSRRHSQRAAVIAYASY
jgi:hypothetical protein